MSFNNNLNCILCSYMTDSRISFFTLPLSYPTPFSNNNLDCFEEKRARNKELKSFLLES